MLKTTEYDNTRQSTDFTGLWETTDVQKYTGWGRQYISKLCSSGLLPYIPGHPNKFVPSSVRAAVANMQVGGSFGRRNARKNAMKRAA